MANTTKTKPKSQTAPVPTPIKLPIAVPIAQGKYLDASLPRKGRKL